MKFCQNPKNPGGNFCRKKCTFFCKCAKSAHFGNFGVPNLAQNDPDFPPKNWAVLAHNKRSARGEIPRKTPKFPRDKKCKKVVFSDIFRVNFLPKSVENHCFLACFYPNLQKFFLCLCFSSLNLGNFGGKYVANLPKFPENFPPGHFRTLFGNFGDFRGFSGVFSCFLRGNPCEFSGIFPQNVQKNTETKKNGKKVKKNVTFFDVPALQDSVPEIT